MDPRSFLESYQVTDIEKDPLPIKVLRNAITKEEIPGQAVHWGFEYVDQRSCPLPLISHILEKLYQEVHQTDFSHCAEAAGDSIDGGDIAELGMRYEPLKLMRAIVNKLDEICIKEREDYYDSVDGIVESHDMLPNVSPVSYNNFKNSRRFMEDRMEYRVNRNLAVSRAIGDADQKTFIISTPDIKMLELDGNEKILILGSDGLWDEISPEAAAQIIRRQVVSDPTKISAVSQKLIQLTKQRGSQDNISVIVVFLEPLESIKNRYEGIFEAETEAEFTILKQSPEPIEVVPMEKFIEHGVHGTTPLEAEMNGHAKENDQIVDVLSFGSVQKAGGSLSGKIEGLSLEMKVARSRGRV